MRRWTLLWLAAVVVAACTGSGTDPYFVVDSHPEYAGMNLVDWDDFDGYAVTTSGGPLFTTAESDEHGYIHLLTRTDAAGDRQELVILTRVGEGIQPAGAEVVTDAMALTGDGDAVRFGIGCSGRAPAAVLDDADNILQAWVPTAPGYVFTEIDPADVNAVEHDEICNR